jgi:hypothetical protein
MPNETSRDIRDALLDAPITRPIPHYSRAGPTRYEHTAALDRTNNSQRRQRVPTVFRTPLHSTLWLQKTCSQLDEEYPTFWSATPKSHELCMSRSSPFEP